MTWLFKLAADYIESHGGAVIPPDLDATKASCCNGYVVYPDTADLRVIPRNSRVVQPGEQVIPAHFQAFDPAERELMPQKPVPAVGSTWHATQTGSAKRNAVVPDRYVVAADHRQVVYSHPGETEIHTITLAGWCGWRSRMRARVVG